MDTGTPTQVVAASKVKMATALLFLGGAALAASAAGGLAGKKPLANGPDLVIKSIFLEIPEEPQDKGGGLIGFGYDLYTITYENIGNVPVNKPFTIIVQSSPNPYETWGGNDPVMYLAANDPVDGDGSSGGFPELITKPAIKVAGSNLYTIPVDSPVGPKLNMYNLGAVSVGSSGGYSGGMESGNIGYIKVYISKFYQDMLGKGGKAKIGAHIDYLSGNRNGVILEKNESNNEKTAYFDKSSYAVVPSNLCSPDYIVPELAKDICKQQDGSYICIDKYTKWYSACVKTAADCAKKVKTTVACEVDVANGQPYIQEVKVTINGQYSKSFPLSYAMGTYKDNANKDTNLADLIKDTSFEYPFDLVDTEKTITIEVIAKNVADNTSFGYYYVGEKSGGNLIFQFPSDDGFFKDAVASKFGWAVNKSTYTFTTKSKSLALYAAVNNEDGEYFGFKSSSFADDAVTYTLKPAAAPSVPTQSTTTDPFSAPPPDAGGPMQQPTPGPALQPSIQSLEISGPGPAITLSQSKIQQNLPSYPESVSDWTWSGPTFVSLHANAINTDANTQYAFYVMYDGSMNINYLLKNNGSKLQWSKSSDFAFSTEKSSYFTVYAFVRNGDNISIISPLIDDYTYKTVKMKYEPPAPGNPSDPPYQTPTPTPSQ